MLSAAQNLTALFVSSAPLPSRQTTGLFQVTGFYSYREERFTREDMSLQTNSLFPAAARESGWWAAKSSDFGVRKICTWILAKALNVCVTLGELLNFLESQFPHQTNGIMDNIYFLELLWG